MRYPLWLRVVFGASSASLLGWAVLGGYLGNACHVSFSLADALIGPPELLFPLAPILLPLAWIFVGVGALIVAWATSTLRPTKHLTIAGIVVAVTLPALVLFAWYLVPAPGYCKF